jgi:hydrogenase maturation protease
LIKRLKGNLSGTPKILVYGYGNPGRQDDGMGIALAEAIETWAREMKMNGVETDSNYQLNIEDAARISEFDLVIFADATKEEIKEYAFTVLTPSPKTDFTMHSVSPAFILNLCSEVYKKTPPAFLLHIKGYEWEFMKEMTPQALKNMEEATVFLKKKILEYKNNYRSGRNRV